MSATCPDDELQQVIERLSGTDAKPIKDVERLIADYPADARLHLLHGSLLAATRQYDAAKEAMGRALEISPHFAIARFQFGFLAFTSGDAAEAFSVWKPLLNHPPDDYLRLFVEGLERLAADDFAGAEERLLRGIASNKINPPLNDDMRLILDAMPPADQPKDGGEEPTSLAQLALQQSAARKKKLN